MTSFYGHAPFSASFPQLGANQGIMAQDMYGQHLPMMMPAEGLGQALQTSSYSPEAGVSPYARGGRVQQSGFPLGGIAATLRTQGRHGDTMLAHINPQEAAFLEAMGGSGTINPETGLPEYFFGGLLKNFKGGIGNILSSALFPKPKTNEQLQQEYVAGTYDPHKPVSMPPEQSGFGGMMGSMLGRLQADSQRKQNETFLKWKETTNVPDRNRNYTGYSAHYRPGFDPEEEAFYDNNSPWQQRYSQGGQVKSSYPLGGLAETLRTQGQEGDTVLAHISPREAAFLAEHFGGDINPETGLPQFGFLSKLWKGVKKVAGPAIGAVLGTILTGGNPIGGAIGGGIGGSFGHPNDRVGPVMGGIGGYFGGPALLKGGSALMAGQGLSGIGAGLSSGFGQSSGMLSSGLSSLGNATGLGSFFGGGGSAAGSAAGASSGGGGLGSFFGGNMLNNALLATAIGGTLLRREKPQGPQSVGEAMMQAEKHRWRPDQYPDKD